MWTRTDSEGRAVKNPSGGCYNWSPHDCRVVGDCYRFTAPGCDVNVYSRVGLPVDLPPQSDLDRWDVFLKLRDSVEKLTTEAEHRKEEMENR